MKIHPGCKPAMWGAMGGAAAIMILGFNWFGWTLGSSAEKMANTRADTAVIAALTPVCVDKFEHQTNASEKLAELKKISSSWDRRSLIEKGGWAIMPGSGTSNSAVAAACAEKLGSQT